MYQDFDVTATDFDKISINKIDSNDTVATVNREVCEVISDKDFLRRTQRNKRGDRLIKRYEELDDDEKKYTRRQKNDMILKWKPSLQPPISRPNLYQILKPR